MGAPRLAHNVTVKQEAYCQGVVSGLSLSDAYRAAYDVNGDSEHALNVAASRLASDTDVALRVDALQREYAAMASLSRGAVAIDLQEDREFARSTGDARAAIKATELRGDLIDAFGKRKLTVDKRSMAVSVDATAEELRALIDAHPDIAQLAIGQGVEDDV
jgi:hypothetical protein